MASTLTGLSPNASRAELVYEGLDSGGEFSHAVLRDGDGAFRQLRGFSKHGTAYGGAVKDKNTVEFLLAVGHRSRA